MNPKNNSWSIVILGLWNRMIFNPSWVGKYIFESETVECLVSVMPQDPTIYRHNGISLLVQDQRLVLQVDKYTQEKLADAEKKALKIIQILPHTPLIAIGINFGFVLEDNCQTEILSVFNHGDDPALTQMGWQIDKRVVERVLEKEGDPKHTLKYTMSLEEKISFDANYHHPIEKKEDGVKVLSNRSVKLLRDLLEMLSQVYSLDFRIDEDNTNA